MPENLIKHKSDIYVKIVNVTPRGTACSPERSPTIRSLFGLKKYVIRYRYAIISSFFLVIVINGLLLISPKILQIIVDELEIAWRSNYDPNYVGEIFTVSEGRLLFFRIAHLWCRAHWWNPAFHPTVYHPRCRAADGVPPPCRFLPPSPETLRCVLR